jgi:hypothetical protein
MGTSLIKFANRTVSQGKSVYWNRIERDGAPFRGTGASLLTEEEYQEKVVRIADFQFGYFDTLIPEEGVRFREVMDAICNSWFKLIHIDRFWHGTTSHYVEWAEFYMEDGTQTAYTHGSPLAGVASHGPGQSPSNY